MKLYLLLFSLLFIVACTSNEIGNSDDVNPEAIFFDYEIWAEQGKENVTIKLQFRMGGPNGTTLVLKESSNVKLDGEEIKLDSAKFSGAYYEIQKPQLSFAGMHEIVFTDLSGREYKEEFEFIPFIIRPDIPEILTRGDLLFNLEGLKPMDQVRVILIDTSFSSDDINDLDSVKNGKLVISKDRLSTLKNGPIHLQFNREYEKPVKNGTREGGMFSMTYRLKRDFELKGQAP